MWTGFLRILSKLCLFVWVILVSSLVVAGILLVSAYGLVWGAVYVLLLIAVLLLI